MRVIVCGSRDLKDPAIVQAALAEHLFFQGELVVVVHGACPTGADKFASDWVKTTLAAQHPTPFLVEEPHLARWERYGNAAGPRRNTEIALLGADLLLAFLARGFACRGTWDMVHKGAGQGIECRIYSSTNPTDIKSVTLMEK